MDNLVYALLFYIAGAVVRTLYGFMSKIFTTDNSELQFDAKYWASMVMSIIVSFLGAVGTFALVIPPGINLVAIFLMSFPSGYALNDAANRGIGVVAGIAARSGAKAASHASTVTRAAAANAANKAAQAADEAAKAATAAAESAKKAAAAASATPDGEQPT